MDPLLFFFGSLAILLVLRRIAFYFLDRSCRKQVSDLALSLLKIIRLPSLFWCFALALTIGLERADLNARAEHNINLLITILVILSVCLTIIYTAEFALKRWLTTIDSSLASSGLMRGLIRTIIFIIGLLIIFDKMGIHIGPLLAAFGVGGLAVGLALKDTLENLFAGINMLIDHSVARGDHVRVSMGLEGVITDIGWRTSKIKMDDGALVIVPNVKLAQDITIRRRSSGTVVEAKVSDKRAS